MSEFKREPRYHVFKRAYLAVSSDEALRELALMTHSPGCVVVESDWPEYELVWDMIKDRVEGRPNRITELKAERDRYKEALSTVHADLLLRGESDGESGTIVSVGFSVWIEVCDALKPRPPQPSTNNPGPALEVDWREQLPPIPKGELYWKCRRMEIAIMESMQRATAPNTCHQISAKIRKKLGSATHYEVGHRMAKLDTNGFLKAVGFDDGDALYVLAPPQSGAEGNNNDR